MLCEVFQRVRDGVNRIPVAEDEYHSGVVN